MLVPDIRIGRRFVYERKPPGKVLLCAVTGAHHYGFPSPDSDLDLKGIHLSPTESLLGLDDPVETVDTIEIYDGVECDYTSHEAKKALKLLLAGNGNMLERIMSPFQLYETKELEELRSLAKQSLSKVFFKHYRGYFQGMCEEHGRNEEPRVKTLLYSYRVALTGIHLLRTGELEANLSVTSKEYGFADIAELIAFKRTEGEKSSLPLDLSERFTAAWPQLEEALNAAHDSSTLPINPPNTDAVSNWLISARNAAAD